MIIKTSLNIQIKIIQEYFKRLLERIKLICTSEMMFYKTIQNKFHFLITENNTERNIAMYMVD